MPRPADPAGGARRARWGAPHRWDARHPGAPWDWRDLPEPPQPPRAARLWVPVVVSLIVQLPAAMIVAVRGDLPMAARIATVAIAVAGPLALIGARRFPGPVVTLVALLASADLFVNDLAGPPYVALAFAIVGAIVRGARLWAFVSVAVCWLATLAIAIGMGAMWHPARVAAVTLGIVLVMGVGEMLRTRQERWREARRLAGERRQSEVQAERVRIARELHDVLAHSLSQINVQAGVGLHLAERQPERAAEALANIKETSKTALDEVRAVLGVLRSEPSGAAPLVPAADLSRLAALADPVRAQGVEVRVDAEGVDAAAVPAAVQAAAYRIVQESLTNVLRHADASRVDVRVALERGRLVIDIADDGRAHAGITASSGGRGLLGMHERAELLGGTLSAGPAATGGFAVRAELPLPLDDEETRP